MNFFVVSMDTPGKQTIIIHLLQMKQKDDETGLGFEAFCFGLFWGFLMQLVGLVFGGGRGGLVDFCLFVLKGI